MIYIGIDPGASGGIAIIDDVRNVLSVCGMPDTERGILDVIKPFAERSVDVIDADTSIRAMLERVSASPQMGVVSAFKFGGNFGALRMALAALRVPYDTVHPAVWTREMSVRDPKAKGALGKGRKPRDKNISKRRAEELFPNVKITHAVAEALLLAEYARRSQKLFS